MLCQVHPRHVQRSKNISEKCGRVNRGVQSKSWFTSGIGTQPVLICQNHGCADERCDKRNSMGHDVSDDIVLCREDKEELEVSLERWRKAFEGRGLKVSREKTEYLQVGGTEQDAVYLQGEKLKKVDHFEYLGLVVSANGSCEEEIRRRVQAGWQSWRRTSGVPCDRKLSSRLKGKIYKCKAGNLIWHGDIGSDTKDGGKDGGCRAEDVEMGIGGYIEGQGEEQVHLGDGKDQKNWREAEGRETEMVWTCEEKGRKLLRQKNDES